MVSTLTLLKSEEMPTSNVKPCISSSGSKLIVLGTSTSISRQAFSGLDMRSSDVAAPLIPFRDLITALYILWPKVFVPCHGRSATFWWRPSRRAIGPLAAVSTLTSEVYQHTVLRRLSPHNESYINQAEQERKLALVIDILFLIFTFPEAGRLLAEGCPRSAGGSASVIWAFSKR